MNDVKRLVAACGYNNHIETVVELLPRVNINARHKNGWTALYTAMLCNNVEIVRLLLGRREIRLDCTVNDSTALHAACSCNNIECVRLFLGHPACTEAIVRMEDKDGNTAETVAARQGNDECACMVNDFLLDVGALLDRVEKLSIEPDRLERLSYSELVAAVNNIVSDEAIFQEKTEAKKRELNEEISTLERKLNDARAKQERQNVEIANDLSEIQNKKNALQAELKGRPPPTQPNSAWSALPSAPSAPWVPSAPASSPPSVVPTCPACQKELWPPMKIFNCSQGHLICSVCMPHVKMNLCVTQCGAVYTGRALAVEQMIRQILGMV